MRGLLAACAVLLAAWSARAEVRSVGPGRAYAAPCAALAAATDGDVIEIDAAGHYDGDVCAIARDRLTIRGVNGRAHIDAAGKNAAGKAIWVIQGDDTTVEDIELSGCHVPDANGAGIRQEGKNLTVRRCYFHDNENGILGGADAASTYLIEDTEFAHNGAGDGYSHNIYVGEIGSFTLRGSYSHHARVGHLVKSRALRNYILYNRLSDETGDASYELDLPQGGPSYVIGNVLQKSTQASNASFLSYAREAKRNPASALWVVSNTFVNARSAGTFVSVAGDVATVVLRDNVFAGPGTLCDLSSALAEANFSGDAQFSDAASYDYELRVGSSAIDHGVAPGSGGGESLQPMCQYAHPARAVRREQVGALDQGAFELGGASLLACGAGAVDAGASPRDAMVPDAGFQDAAGVTSMADASEPTEPVHGGCQTTAGGTQAWSVLLLLALASRRRIRRDAWTPPASGDTFA